jgi:hypothetical protein
MMMADLKHVPPRTDEKDLPDLRHKKLELFYKEGSSAKPMPK